MIAAIGSIGGKNKEFTEGHVRPLPKFALGDRYRLKAAPDRSMLRRKQQGSQTLDGLCR
jgi:hypothetical protein